MAEIIEKVISRNNAQNRVAQKFKSFVAIARKLLFVGVGRMGKCNFKKFFVFEFIAYCFLKFVKHIHASFTAV